MSSLKFEGVFEDLTDKQCQYIRDVLEKRGFVDNKVVFAPVGKVGDNYAANVKRITVELENGENFSLVAKIASSAEMLRAMMNTGKIFNNEAIMYLEILPKFRELQRSANVEEEDILRYPECYGCNTEAPDEVILLEDLKTHNFVMLDRFQSIPNEAVKLILKNFAILHSLSFVLKKIDPDTYNNYASKLFDMWNSANDTPEFSTYITQMEEDALKLLENDDDKYKNVLRGAIHASTKLSNKLAKRDAGSKFLIIQQGDAWTNNIMFRSENDQLKECIMIDYQLAKCSNPACDLLYMIFNCTDYKTRTEHFFEWLDYYHRHLDTHLHNFGIKANFVYPKDQLDADIKRYSKVFFGTAVVIFSMLVRKTDEAVIMQDFMKDNIDLANAGESMAVSLLSSETIELYKSRVRDLIDSCRELGFL